MLVSPTVRAPGVQPRTQAEHGADTPSARKIVQPLGGENAGVIVDALNRHRGFLRGELGHSIELKFTPELRFVEDTSFAEAQRIERILHSERVARDLRSPDAPAKDDDGP